MRIKLVIRELRPFMTRVWEGVGRGAEQEGGAQQVAEVQPPTLI